MNEETMRKIMLKTVNMTLAGLSDDELAVLNIVGQLDQDPHGRLFDYEKVKHLFTERNGTRMHQETKVALATIVNHRLGVTN